MKKRFMSILAVAAVLAACESKEDPVVPEITAPLTEYQIPVSGTEEEDVFIEFTTNVDWTATLKEASEWCAVTPQKGVKGLSQVKVIADENNGNEDRSAVVVIKAGAAEQEITLNQSGKPHLILGQNEVYLERNGAEVSIPVTANVKFTAEAAADCDWLTVTADASSIKFTAIVNDDVDYRSTTVAVKVADYEDLNAELTVFQNGKISVAWSKVPNGSIDGYDPAAGARLAVYGDYLLLANGSKIFALNAADGTVAQTINLPEGMKAQSLCVDEGGNVLFAANAAWAAADAEVPAEILQIYTVKSLTDTPKLLIEYNAGNLWCTSMCNVRVKGDISKDAVITAYAAYSAYWMAWEVKGGAIGDLKYEKTPYTSGVNSGCVAPNGTSLSDGLWFIGYGAPYNLYYCTDTVANTWVESYVTGSSWMENYDCISTATVGSKKYLATVASCHFDYDTTDVILVDVTDPKAGKEYIRYACDNLVNRDESWANKDWTAAGTFADVCLVAKGETMYVYFIDAQFGAMGCLKIQ